VDSERFVDSPIGTVVPINGTDRIHGPFEHFAYVPNPIPVSCPPLSTGAHRAVADAMLELGRLDRVALQVPNPALLRDPTLRREAQSTSALEGTFAPLEQVLAADAKSDAHMAPELREILNYVTAAELAFQAADDGRVVTASEIRELHGVLVKGTKADGDQAGRVRGIQVAIGPKGRPITESRFVPQPPGDQLDADFRSWVDWFNNDFDGDPVTSAALSHYQFETMHPFNDGNGRLGRLLVVVHLLQRDVLSQPILAISPWFERNRSAYQDQLAQVSATGDWSPWVEFFAIGLASSALDAANHANQMLQIQAVLREKVRSAKSSKSQVALNIIDEVLGLPIFTVKQMSDRIGVGVASVNTQVDKLVALGVIAQWGPETYNRRFTAPDLLRALMSW
jgi:Fic family protein